MVALMTNYLVFMVTGNDLSVIAWLDVAVLHPLWDKNAVVIVLIFDTKAEGEYFVRNILAKNEFGFATTIDEDCYVFHINFEPDGLGLERPTIIPKEQYDFKLWYRQKKTFFITNGVWLGMERMFDAGDCGMVKVNKMFFS
jgi:hypothetical protein